MRIIYPSGDIYIVQPFDKRESKQCVQLRCNIGTSEHNLFFSHAQNQKKRKNNPELVVEFSLSAFRTIAMTPMLIDFASSVKSGKRRSLVKNALPLDAAMNSCIYSITQYVGEEELTSLFLYSRAVELVLLQQENYKRNTTPQPQYVKTEYDKERIVFARDYLLTHMDAPPTLSKLAVIAGINEFKLKRGFRELFNQSVFAYLADVRLEMARTALRQKQKSITQIAFELGYASLQHFSMSFKKKFGVAPAKFN